MDEIASLVRTALEGDTSWSSTWVEDGREGARQAALDEFDDALGFALPATYRYLAIHHPDTMTGMRLFTDADLPTKLEIGPFDPSLSYLEQLLPSQAEQWRAGEFAIDLLGDSPPPAVIGWAPFLVPLFSSGDDLACYDFRFDGDDPPIVLIRNGRLWQWPAPRAKAVFVADNLLAYFGLEIVTEENWDGTPADPPTERQLAWTAWRDTELIPLCDDR